MVGEAQIVSALEEYLSLEEAGPATFAGLIEHLERSSGVSLEYLHADYIDGGALPVLTLEDVIFRRRGTEWAVSGRVTNLGTGRTICPVILRTLGASEEVLIRAESERSVGFELRSGHEPRSLLLDPRNRCFRFSPRVRVTETVPFSEKI